MAPVRAGIAFAVLASIAAIAPATAAAAPRFASPGGTPADACTQPDPCNLEKAVEGAADGDDVTVLPGLHAPADEVSLTTATVVHGVDGQPAPQILSASGTAISVTDPGARLRWLDIRHTGGGDALLLDDGSASLLTVRSTSAGFACNVLGAVLQDSICWATDGGDAAGMLAAGVTEHTSIYNVTAVALGPGSTGLRVEGQTAGFADLRALNLIAEGAVDTHIESDVSSIAVANIDYSNFATQDKIGVNSFASTPGLSRNQTAQPQFVDAAAGNFDEDPSSPTIDRGTLEVNPGEADADGDARVQGFGIDIGAQELFVGPLAPDSNPPDTRILKKPDSRSKKRLSKFKFGTTEPAGAEFMCSVDGKPFTRCSSPKKFRVRRGRRHRFAVYSIDEAGNIDPSPDVYSWKVKAK